VASRRNPEMEESLLEFDLVLDLARGSGPCAAKLEQPEAEFTKRWIVHPLIGNVSWV
jgi:hypothetical protein